MNVNELNNIEPSVVFFILAIVFFGIALIVRLVIKSERKNNWNNIVEITSEDYELSRMIVDSPEIRSYIEKTRKDFLMEYGLPKFKKIVTTIHIHNTVDFPLYLAIKEVVEPYGWDVTHYEKIERIKIEVTLFE